jgi:hypothetical protein
MVKRRIIIKELELAGFTNVGGAKHDTFIKCGYMTRVPRHSEINDLLYQEIRKQAGLKK